MKLTMVLMMACAALILAQGCKKESPLEKAGRDMDRAAERTKDNLKDAGKKTGDAIEDAGKKVQDATKP